MKTVQQLIDEIKDQHEQAAQLLTNFYLPLAHAAVQRSEAERAQAEANVHFFPVADLQEVQS